MRNKVHQIVFISMSVVNKNFIKINLKLICLVNENLHCYSKAFKFEKKKFNVKIVSFTIFNFTMMNSMLFYLQI